MYFISETKLIDLLQSFRQVKLSLHKVTPDSLQKVNHKLNHLKRERLPQHSRPLIHIVLDIANVH